MSKIVTGRRARPSPELRNFRLRSRENGFAGNYCELTRSHGSALTQRRQPTIHNNSVDIEPPEHTMVPFHFVRLRPIARIEPT